MHTWKGSYFKGKQGEERIIKYYSDLGYECNYLSVKNQKLYGFDFIAKSESEKLCIEVKTEYRAEKTGNIFYETLVDDKPGWCLKYSTSSPVTICWYFPHLQEIALYPARDLRNITYEVFPKKEVINSWGKGYKAEGYVIPLTYIKAISDVRMIK